MVENIMTAEKQQMMSPQDVLQSLKEGNMRFVNDEITTRLHSQHIRITAQGQYPKAIVLSCLDSRIPVEDIFDKGIGDLFVARIAGNFINEDILGSMEFACKISGAKLVLVIGHERCGAIKGAIDKVELGNLTALVAKIQPAVQMTENYEGEKTTKNDDYVYLVAKNNVIHSLARIRNESPILVEMEQKGEILIIGAMYDLDTGVVEFLG